MGAGALLPLKPEEKAPTPLCPPAPATGTSASAACVFSRPETSCAPASMGAGALVIFSGFSAVSKCLHSMRWRPPAMGVAAAIMMRFRSCPFPTQGAKVVMLKPFCTYLWGAHPQVRHMRTAHQELDMQKPAEKPEISAGAHWASMRAAVPATCGVAMDVPESVMYRPPRPVDSTCTPGAAMCTVLAP